MLCKSIDDKGSVALADFQNSKSSKRFNPLSQRGASHAQLSRQLCFVGEFIAVFQLFMCQCFSDRCNDLLCRCNLFTVILN